MPGWSPPPPEVRPGVIPLRPLSVLEILDGAITTIRSYPRATLGLAAVVVTISQLFQFGALWFAMGRISGSINSLPEQPTFDDIIEVTGGAVVGVLISTVVAALAQIVLTGLVTVVVSRGALGRGCSIADAWQVARPQLGRLLGVTVVSGLIVGGVIALGVLPGLAAALADAPTGLVVLLLVVGIMAGLVAGVYLYVALALASPAVVLERQGVRRALARSRALVKGTWWRILGILLLTNIIVTVLAGILALPLSLLGGATTVFATSDDVSVISLALSSLSTIISGTLTWPFVSAVAALLYIDVRMRREGLDLELARAAGVAPSP